MNLFSQIPKVGILRQPIIWQAKRCFHISQTTPKQVLTKTLRIKHEDFYKRMDGVPEYYEMIYKLPLHYTLNFGKQVAVVTPCFVACAWLYTQFSLVNQEAINFVSFYAASQDELVWFFGGLIITNLIVYRVCHIATLRIYCNQQSYIAIQSSLIPRRNKQIHFEKGQVAENFKAISIFRGLSYKLNNKAVLLVPDRFRKSSDLHDMLHENDAKKYKKRK